MRSARNLENGFSLIGVIIAVVVLAAVGGGWFYFTATPTFAPLAPEENTKNVENNAGTVNSASDSKGDSVPEASREAACSGDVAQACPSPEIPVCRNGRWICVGPASGSGAATPGLTAPGATGTPSETASAENTAKTALTVNVEIKNFVFAPKELRIKVGTKVVWTNQDSVKHNAVSDTGIFNGPLLAKGESYERTFDKAGTFPYHCAPHPDMRATVIVE